jgi:hypothetical protein
MPLRNRYYLSDASAEADNASTHRIDEQRNNAGWIKPLWILPRAWCVTTSLQAKGVPTHKTAAFVKLHLARLMPFVDCGVYACRSGDWVHLWFWENQRVRGFCARHTLDFESLHLAPESVCFPRQKEAAVLQQCLHGVEAQLWHQGFLLDSAWWPEMIDTGGWQTWRPSAAAASGVRAAMASWPESLPSMSPQITPRDVASSTNLAEPWAYNLLGKKWWHVLKELRSDKLFLLAAGCVLAWGGYLVAQWSVLHGRQQEVETKINLLSPKIEPLNLARSQALESQQWVNKLTGLRKQDNVQELLANLQPVLQEQEAAIREFEYLDGEVRLMLVPINTELNLVALTQELEALPQLSNVRLLPDSDGRLTRFSFKLVHLGKPNEIRVLGQKQDVDKTIKVLGVTVERSGKREKGE